MIEGARNLRGILLMGSGFFLFAGGDAAAKFLLDSLHPVQISAARYAGLLLGVLVFLALRGGAVLRTRRPVLQVMRGALATVSVTSFVIALAYVPLADATAVTFVAPFIVTVLGALILGEKVGLRRWIAIGAGFAGTLVVIRPGMGVAHPAVLLVLLSAGCFALRQIISRLVSGVDPLATTVSYSALTAGGILLGALPFFWVPPADGTAWLLLCVIAISAGMAEFLVIKALEMADAVVVAPVMYSMILWTTAYGWLIFGDFPDLWTMVGTTVIVATGIYMINRERQAAQKAHAALRT